MKNYELTIIFHPDLEMNLDPALDKVRKLISQNGGEITKEEDDGKKRLAYAIKGQEYGLYYFIDVTLPADAPSKIEAAFGISDEILRSLLVKVDPRKLKQIATAPAEEPATSDSAEKGE